MTDWKRLRCEACDGRGRFSGTREVAGKCGTRRGTTERLCQECWGNGYIEIRSTQSNKT